MKTRPGTTGPNAQILEEAAEWFVDLSEGNLPAEHCNAFSAWLRRSPENVAAYLEVSAFWADAPMALGTEPGPDVDAIVAAALAEDNVVILPAAADPSCAPAPPVRTFRNGRLAQAAGVMLVMGAVTAAVWGIDSWRRPVYATGLAEQRSITLSDGSTVQLNARSRVRLRFTDTERVVELAEGQALFAVAKDPARPFVVASGAARVRAIGTQFDVARRRSGTTITVLEGRVAVLADSTALEPAAAGARPAVPAGRMATDRMAGRSVYLAAGEQVTITAGTVSVPQPANRAAATAWTQRRLIFSASRLADVVEEFNRYNSRPIEIGDPGLESLEISGVYSSTDPASLLRFLEEQPYIRVEIRDHEVRILRR